MSEDLPEDVNRVQLDDTVKDSNGIPAPRVTYRASDNTKAILQHGAHAARQVSKPPVRGPFSTAGAS